jgi:penicillin-binding protein 1A
LIKIIALFIKSIFVVHLCRMLKAWYNLLLKFWTDKAKPFLRPILGKLVIAWKKLWAPSVFNRTRFKTLTKVKKVLSLGYTGLVSLILFIFLLETNFLFLFGYMPSMAEVKNPKVPLITEIYTSDEVLLGTFFIEKRTPVGFEEIDSNTIHALIATEDFRFYDHHGLDLYALFSAAFSTVKGQKRGGSTITNQLVKNMYKTRQKSAVGIMGRIPLVRTLIAKVKEWITAIKIEFFFEKNEILTMYFNTVNFGNNSFGIQTASEYYFSKKPSELKLEESALLVGMLKGPSYYNPNTHPDRAINRRNVVLSQMAKYEYISDKTFEKYKKKKLALKINRIVKEEGFASYARSAITRELEVWCEENGINLFTDGCKVYTNLHSKIQKHAEASVTGTMQYIQQSFQAGLGGHKTWFDRQIKLEQLNINKQHAEALRLHKKSKSKEALPIKPSKTATELKLLALAKQSTHYRTQLANGVSDSLAILQLFRPKKSKIFKGGKEVSINLSTVDSIKMMLQILQCGLVSIEPTTGKIRAWVGGVSWDHFQFDHVQQARRQPGSTFKPIVYATAVDGGKDPCSRIVDEPLKLSTYEGGVKKDWTPQNSDRSFSYQALSLRQAMAYSKNTIAVKLIEEFGAKNVVKMAQAMGIESELDPTYALALGSSAVTLLELTQAYTVFANGGKLIKARLVDRIEDHNGKELANFSQEAESEEIFSASTAYAIITMLRGTVEEPGATAQRLWSYGICEGNEIGGKTGTTSNYSDGWFVGITQNLVTGVWVGGDDMRIHFDNANGQGGRTALPVFGRFMQLVYSDPGTGVQRSSFIKPDPLNFDLSCYQYIQADTMQNSDTTVIMVDSTDFEEVGEDDVLYDTSRSK